MSEPVTLSKRDERIIARLKAGQTLHAYNYAPPTGDDGERRKRFFFEPGGASAHGYSVRKLLAANLLKPAEDGLFEGFTQTYELAE